MTTSKANKSLGGIPLAVFLLSILLVDAAPTPPVGSVLVPFFDSVNRRLAGPLNCGCAGAEFRTG